ncbi:MAG TPA: hypothetical protein VKU02_20195 [Gemmataceae bacterium]|nr:hypothetical protein [Gemmataceae bacterium]
MRHQHPYPWLTHQRRVLVRLLSVGLAALPWASAEPKSASGQSATVATASSEKGTILRRRGTDPHNWQVVSAKESLHAGDLLVGLPGAQLESKDGSVRLDFLADLDRLSPYPIRECAVQLGESANVDLDVILDRGRMDLVNRKQKGPAHVQVHVRKDRFDLTLAEPGARVALELFGRWPRGVPFSQEPGPKQMPVASLLILALAGEATLKHEHHEHALKAPPGPALVEWDSVTGMDETPRRLEKLPPWAGARGEDTPEGKQRKAALERLRQALASKPVATVVDEFLNSDNPVDRGLAINLVAAVDDLSRLGQALRETKYPDVWENGVVALRNWIGRGPGQDQLLYKRLIEVAKYKPIHAETVLQLLHSFGDIELAQPETFQTLIDYLDHDALAIRGLAYWHLSRLVPEGKKFGYNPVDPKEKREAAIQKWRELIPKGQIPPRPKDDSGNG